MLDSAYQLTAARYLRPKSSAIKQRQLNRVTLVQMDNVLISTCVENRHTYIYKVLSITDENNSLTHQPARAFWSLWKPQTSIQNWTVMASTFLLCSAMSLSSILPLKDMTLL